MALLPPPPLAVAVRRGEGVEEGGRRNLNLTQEALRATQNKVLSSGISPPPASRKTISPVIKGELNRLISSKVTERPPPPTPPPPPPRPCFSVDPGEVEAINEMPSDLLEVIGQEKEKKKLS